MRSIAIDIESIGVELIGGLVWSIAINTGKKILLEKNPNGLLTLTNETADMLEDDSIEKIIHNAAFDCSYLFHNCHRQNGKQINVVGPFWDTDLCEQVVQAVQATRKLDDDDPFKIAHGTKLGHTLVRYRLVKKMNKELVYRFVGREKGIPFDKDELNYMVDDVKYLPALRVLQEKVLRRDKQLDVALLENEFVRIIIEGRKYGMGFDSEFWGKLADKNTKEFNRRITKLPKEVSNWNSEKQVKSYFQRRGIFIASYSELDEIATQTKDKVLNDFIFARSLHKSVTAYGHNWFTENFIGPDGRIRFDMRQMVSTGRNSISRPPMHGIPKEGDHRKAFIPRPGYRFVKGDFSGQEIGIMAAMSNEKLWVDALLRGDDVHSLTASRLYEGEWENGTKRGCRFPNKCECPVHKKLREYAKTINFMLAYGGGPLKFSKKTGLEMYESRIVVARHKKLTPSLTKALDKNAREALNTGEAYSADPYRRRRVLLGEEDWHIRNQGMNSPIQMAGANMMKLAAISVPKKYYIPLIIHDEIILEVPAKEAKKAVRVLKSVMEQAADYITGIKGLIKVQPTITMNIMKD